MTASPKTWIGVDREKILLQWWQRGRPSRNLHAASVADLLAIHFLPFWNFDSVPG
jgi:hypothetical protein